ncbi:VOC family protein [Methanoregula formicica]|uniref:Lactoylglutathione lyase family protein n=1 Tax=Methanoregula formicica (strain DSM 22288 / NBRC 105244 / SMSP) TaxID=593750 RepID=L0HF96_METFS|nr:VOC family protein [Methanoregula formicica]AGB01993.1 lactoylglutathione lyase family protein [Methanoregula formicica SMSP]
MPNIAYFEIPANNVDRAKHFYKNLLGWMIEPIKTPTMDLKSMEAIQYNEITLGEPTLGTINMGGLYKRQGDETIKNYVMVDDIDKVVAKVEKLGGKIVMPKFMIKGVGLVAVLQDTEGNGFGVWTPKM